MCFSLKGPALFFINITDASNLKKTSICIIHLNNFWLSQQIFINHPFTKKSNMLGALNWWPWPVFAILFRPFGLFAPKIFEIIWFSNLLTLSIPNEGYSRNVSCTLNWMSMLLYTCTQQQSNSKINKQKYVTYLLTRALEMADMAWYDIWLFHKTRVFNPWPKFCSYNPSLTCPTPISWKIKIKHNKIYFGIKKINLISSTVSFDYRRIVWR